ncbi:MAG TPA: polyamine aminopropyltransferase, partial [Polyangiaceae bacterium]|nr:polyamine aminopropyltransferase [Polyangiaceae bacterium]
MGVVVPNASEPRAAPETKPVLPAALLYLNVFVVSTCGLVYELLAGTLGSYLLGDSVKQFSLVIGLYLSAMGVGAWLSRFIEQAIAERFLDIELAVALVGGTSVPFLFLLFPALKHFDFALFGLVFVIGVLVGLELPLLLRLLQGEVVFKDLVSRVLTFDYVGALAAALAFPLLFVPELGLVRTSLLMGLLNAGVAFWGTWLLRPVLVRSPTGVRVRAGVVAVLLAAGLVQADRLTSLAEDRAYADSVVTAQTTPYQRIVVTANRGGFNLFLNGNLQFSSADEYRYHEALVHPAMASAGRAIERVLILGGGDGLAAREVLAHPGVRSVTLVDLDPAMTSLARNFQPLASLNRNS